MTQIPLRKSIPWSNIRWLTVLLGVILFVLGEVQIADSTFQVKSVVPLGDWLTNTLHLGVPDINNVLLGLPILLAGALLLAVSLRGLYLLPPETSQSTEETPPHFQFVRPAWPWLLGGSLAFAILLTTLSRLKYSFLSPVVWILSMLIFAVTATAWDHRRGVDFSPHLTRKDLIWLIGLLTVGLLIGAYRLQGWPDQLIGDEGNFWTIARDIASGKFNPPIFGSGVYSFPVLSSLLQGWIMRLFGISLWGWRMASVLPGIVTVVPLYLLARDLFNRRIAVIASIILISSPYFLAFARLGYNNIQAVFITALPLYWIYIGLQRNSYSLIFLGGVACGLGFYTYFGARGTIVIALVFILLMALTRRIHWRQAFISSGILLLAMVLTTGPYFAYGLHQDAETMGFKTFESVFFNVFNGEQFYSDTELIKYAPVLHLGGNDLFFNPKIYGVLFSQGLLRTLLAFIKSGLISEHYIAFPLAGSVGVLFFLLGLGLAFRNIKEPRHQLMILWFLVYIIGFSALNTVPPRHTHMVAVIPTLALLTAVGVNACAETVGLALHKFRRAGLILSILLAGVVAVGGLYDYFVLAPAKYPPQPDQILSWAALDSHGETLVYVYQEDSQKDFKPYIISEFLPSTHYQNVAVDRLAQSASVFPTGQKTIVFYPPALSGMVEPALQRHWGETFIQKNFTSSDGTPILSAGMNTPFLFERDRPLIDTFADAFRHVSFDITLLLLLIAGLLAALLRAPGAIRLPGWLRQFLDWFNRPSPPETVEVLAAETLLVTETPPDAIISRPLAEEIHELVDHLSQTSQRTSLPPAHFPNSVLLIASVFLAFAGQLAVTRHGYLPGAILYGLCGIGLFAWSRRNSKWMDLFTRQLRVSRRVEIILAVALFIGIAFTRFYDLGYRVYGIEADESKWTVQSWYSTILRVDQGDFATAHYKYLPVSFWVRSAFLRLFGLNFLSARIESAFLSLISAVFLYFLVRRLTTSPPIAWLSTALYSLSFVELSASHQALHNTTIEAWMMGGLFLTVLAVHERKWWQFQLAGVVLGLGMLTYETFFPIPLLATLFMVGFGIHRLVKKKDSPAVLLKQFLIFLWPMALLFFIYIQKYLGTQGFQFAAFNQSTAHGSDLTALGQFMLKNTGDLLKTLFDKIVWTDSLLYWAGPFLNPWLIVFVVIGFYYNLLNLRRPYFSLIPLWFLLDVLYAPILVGSVWPRVLYAALGPLVIWGTMGLWTFLAALRAWMDGLRLKIAAPIFILLLAAIFINDYHIFTTELLDAPDRVKRRELADLTAQSAADVPMTLYPYAPNQDDSAFVESHVLLFSTAGSRRTSLDASKYYRALPFEQLLSTLYQDRRTAGLNLVYDKDASSLAEDRQSALKVVLRCYPGAVLQTTGKFFDVYHFDPNALMQTACYQGPEPLPVFPPDNTVFPEPPDRLEWESNGLPISSVAITVERKVTENYWIEVEDTFKGPGWGASSEFVNGFSGNGFLFDNWDSGAAEYSLPVDKAGRYQVWVRSYKREKNDQTNFITLQGKTTEFASNSNRLNTWVWEEVGTYPLSQDALPISLTRKYGADPQYSVFIDTILLTPDLAHFPEEIPAWENVLDTGRIQLMTNTYTFNKPLPSGDYRWSVRLFDGDRLVDSTGAPGLASPMSEFVIR